MSAPLSRSILTASRSPLFAASWSDSWVVSFVSPLLDMALGYVNYDVVSFEIVDYPGVVRIFYMPERILGCSKNPKFWVFAAHWMCSLSDLLV